MAALYNNYRVWPGALGHIAIASLTHQVDDQRNKLPDYSFDWQELSRQYRPLCPGRLLSSNHLLVLFCHRPSIYVLGLPWFCFSLAFLLIGLPSVSLSILSAHKVLAEVATWFYAIASAASFAFFGLNFGEEAGAATEVWTLRACIVQGSQQLWIAALWHWGSTLDNIRSSHVPSWYICLAVWPLSIICLIFGILMFYGLPDYYRQALPKVHDLLTSLFRRKLVVRVLISEVLRDYWSLHMVAIGPFCGAVVRSLNGRFCSSSSPSLSEYGPSYSWYSLISAKRTRGFCQCLHLVSVLPGGARFCGVPPPLRFTFHRPEKVGLISVSGWVYSMQCKVLV
ncbi:hypothetical protein B0H11DRAFT_127616 [Mycena galericulata]|nr:hypothetical protein B0H11DRAFT_127616 [Mycena galericulata]